MSRADETGLADQFAPVLPGLGASDHERYLRTDELLALQKPARERAHHDELLFQVTHESSELWLKLCAEELKETVAHLLARELAPALRLLRRAHLGSGRCSATAAASILRAGARSGRLLLCLRLITNQLDMLEQMSPWEYTR